ncbi:MAG: hypothetical protein A2V67_06280 [Deltaproteobacteria bacterium RBG_13_61_14]|nr:MAG: hypothetical protein A2V67_06280 [Deltaproteobacteria bacterium RBG_13_61_14]
MKRWLVAALAKLAVGVVLTLIIICIAPSFWRGSAGTLGLLLARVLLALLFFGYLFLLWRLSGFYFLFKAKPPEPILPHPIFQETLDTAAVGYTTQARPGPSRIAGKRIFYKPKKIKYRFICHSPLVEKLRFHPKARWYKEQ